MKESFRMRVGTPGALGKKRGFWEMVNCYRRNPLRGDQERPVVEGNG